MKKLYAIIGIIFLLLSVGLLTACDIPCTVVHHVPHGYHCENGRVVVGEDPNNPDVPPTSGE